jgi:ribokinase
MRKPRLVVFGSSNTDLIVRVPHIPQPGETILGGEFVTAAGGKGANQAVAAARAGGEVTFVTRVGDDRFGEEAEAGFIRDDIHVRHVRRERHCPSGVALIFVAANGQNSIAVAPGANARLTAADARRARADIERADVLVAQLEVPLPAVTAAIQLAAHAGVPVILNPAPAANLPPTLLRLVSVLTPNESEARLLTGINVTDVPSAARAARRLHSRGVQTVILTLGQRGALLSQGRQQELVAGFRVKAVDTTAAGDVFNGALAVALAEQKPLSEAVRFANAAAALSVTRLGAQPSAPTRGEIEQMLRRRE